jgi:hypothetical protein
VAHNEFIAVSQGREWREIGEAISDVLALVESPACADA